jgi:hypothetical protein
MSFVPLFIEQRWDNAGQLATEGHRELGSKAASRQLKAAYNSDAFVGDAAMKLELN